EVCAGRRHPPWPRSRRAARDWSYELLSERERQVFARLSVFLGGFTLDDAEAVLADGQLPTSHVLDALGSLVERSLVEYRSSSYRLLRALREYAGQRLDESGESAAIRERHARYSCAQAETANRERRGPDRARWLAWLAAEYANLRAGMAWARSAGAHAWARSAGAHAWARSAGAHELSLRYAIAMTW